MNPSIPPLNPSIPPLNPSIPPLAERIRRLETRLEESILVLDGGMGTMIQTSRSDRPDPSQRFALPRGRWTPIGDPLSITHPAVIQSIHEEFLEAGADIIETNTFSANRISLSGFGLAHQVRTINIAAARIARSAADRWTDLDFRKPRFVAGAVGPTSRYFGEGAEPVLPERPSSRTDRCVQAYCDQARALLEGGVDLLLAETMTGVEIAEAALAGFEQCFGQLGFRVPVLVSFAPPEENRPQQLGAILEWTEGIGDRRIAGLGFNCGRGSAAILAPFDRLTEVAPGYALCCPSAGLPDADGAYPETPESMAAALDRLARSGGVNLVGGCCGTGPDHIRRLNDTVSGYAPRRKLGRDRD